MHCGARVDVTSWFRHMFQSSSMRMQCLIFQVTYHARVIKLYVLALVSNPRRTNILLGFCPFFDCPFEHGIQHAGSTATVWSWSTGCVRADSWKTKQTIAVLGTPHVTAETRSEICRILAWDFRQLESGLYDYVNHCGMFHAVGSAREKQAGDYLPMKAVA